MVKPSPHGFQLKPLPASLLVLSATAVAGSIGLQLGSVAVFLWAPFVFAALALSVAGALITTRHPGNAIGWIFSRFGLFSSSAMVAGAYGIRAGDFGWPGGSVGEWIGSWSWLVEFSLWPLILVLFPNGRPPSRGWAFATRLRYEVDVDSLTNALRAVSHSTVRPVTTSVWLRADR